MNVRENGKGRKNPISEKAPLSVKRMQDRGNQVPRDGIGAFEYPAESHSPLLAVSRKSLTRSAREIGTFRFAAPVPSYVYS